MTEEEEMRTDLEQIEVLEALEVVRRLLEAPIGPRKRYEWITAFRKPQSLARTLNNMEKEGTEIYSIHPLTEMNKRCEEDDFIIIARREVEC
jgi:hypothetical protein